MVKSLLKSCLIRPVAAGFLLSGICILAQPDAGAQVVQAASLTENYGAVLPARSGALELLHFAPKEVGEESRAALDRIISIDLVNVPMEEALQAIAKKSGLRVAYSKDVADAPWQRPVTVRYDRATVLGALYGVLGDTDLKLTLSSDSGDAQLVVVRGSIIELHPEAVSMAEEVQQSVSGRITDASTGESIPGVNILVEGTTSGTTTDLDGYYQLNVSNLQQTLVISYIGYASQRVPLEGRSQLDIRLDPIVTGLDEVVVTAFGLARDRASLAYSVTEVGGESLAQAREINVANALTGKVAGVNATSMASGAGGSSRVVIRGSGSFGANNQPLYVVNGMPITNEPRVARDNVGGSRVDYGDGIMSINPDDIESISVLKGGAAAALYGSDAANGVILITTKQGSADRMEVEYSSNFTVGHIALYPQYQYEYGQGNNARRPQSQTEAITTGRLSFGEKMDGQPYVNFAGETRPYSPVSVKQNMKNFYRPSTNATNTLVFSGGSSRLIYRASISDLRAENIQPNSGYQRKTANINLKTFLSDNLSLETMVQFNNQQGRNRPGVDYVGVNANWGVYLLANTVDVRDLAPGYNPETLQEVAWQHVSEATNPYFVINRMGNSDQTDRFITQAALTYNILPNLYVKGDFSRDFNNHEQESFTPMGTNYRPLGNYQSSWRKGEQINARLIAGYETEFMHDYSLSAMVGGNVERITNKDGYLNGEEFVIPEWISHVNLASTTSGKGIYRRGTNSLFSSVDLGWREMLFLSLTGRQDWFSTLRSGSNSIFYPSIGGSFLVSRAVTLPEVISLLRVRAAWAQVGSSTVGIGEIIQTYNFRQGGHLGRPVQTTSTSLTNPDLRPLTSTTSEVGLDLELMQSRLRIDFTYYDRLSKDDIISTSIANTSGASSTTINAGEISNKGIELLISGDPIRRNDLGWTVSYNLGYNKNKVLSLAPGQTTGGTSVLGRDMSSIFYHTWQTTDDGTVIFNEVSGYQLRTDVPVFAGVGVPPWTMGLTNTVRYKNWIMDVLIDGKFGNHFFSQAHQYMHRFGLARETLPGREDGLTVTGVDRDGNPFTHFWPAEAMGTYYNNEGTHNQMLFVQDGSFVKLRSVVIGYTIPTERISFLQGAQVSLVARNLAILYKKTKHFDPEQSFLPNDNVQGSAGVMLPRTRDIGLHLRLNF